MSMVKLPFFFAKRGLELFKQDFGLGHRGAVNLQIPLYAGSIKAATGIINSGYP